MKGECIMKRIKPYVFAVLVLVTVMCLSACGSNKNAGKESTGGSSSAAETTTSMESSSSSSSSSSSESGSETSRNADEDSEESTGVIDGMINDVEKGVDDITGESNGHPTTGADMSSAAE